MSMMRELKFFLGLQIKQTPNGIYIHQTKYVKKLLKKFNMNHAKEVKTPMHPTTYLGLDEVSTKVDETQYRAMIGSLLYLTRLDLISCLVFAYVQDFNKNHGKSI